MGCQKRGTEFGLHLWIDEDEDDLQAPAEQNRPAGHAKVCREAQNSAAFILHLGKTQSKSETDLMSCA